MATATTLPVNYDVPNTQRLEASPEWANLTTQQRVWVTVYLATGGSALTATKVAYPKAKSEKNSRVMSYELAKNSRILAALSVAAGKFVPEKTETERLAEGEERQRKSLIRTVQKQLDAAEPGSIAAQKFSDQLERLKIGVKRGPYNKADKVKAEQTSVSVVEDSTPQVPSDALEVWHDKDGALLGYRNAEGEAIKL